MFTTSHSQQNLNINHFTYHRALVLNVWSCTFEYYNQLKVANPLIAFHNAPIFDMQEEFLLCLESLLSHSL